jgi:glycosyltransferase involved in cell wall biosynthesis
LTSIKAVLRPPLARALWPFTRPWQPVIERSRDGERLLPGITALVAARDEAYTVGPCLASLVGFVDQIVCVDNGSEDGTLQQMHAFADRHSHEVDVDVVSMPGALLVDCREEGIRRTRHQWHLLWAGDMVVQTSGPHDVAPVRERILRDDRPRTITFSRTNLVADLHHTFRAGPVVDPGEPFLMRFGRGIKYREFGRFDAARAPLYYAQRREPGRHIFHLGGLKSDANLMHRFHYFAWRETVNREGEALDPELRTLEGFKRQRNQELFGTNDPRSLKFRYQRQLSYSLARYDAQRYGDYPVVLQDALAGPQRFEVVYRDGRPWSRIDHEDTEMLDYQPTADDLAWDPEAFLRGFLSAAECRALGVEPQAAT